MNRQPGRFAVAFVFITVFIDMVGFGLVMPVLPRLIEEVSGSDLAGRRSGAGGCSSPMAAMQSCSGRRLAISPTPSEEGRCCCSRCSGWRSTTCSPPLRQHAVAVRWAGLRGNLRCSYTTAMPFRRHHEARGACEGLRPDGGGIRAGLRHRACHWWTVGEFGARVPFFVAAGLSLLNFIYGWFVLPETLAPENRRAFSWARSNPIGALKVFAHYRGVVPLSAVIFLYFLATAVYRRSGPSGASRPRLERGHGGADAGSLRAGHRHRAGRADGAHGEMAGERNTVIFGFVMAVVVLFGYGVARG